MEKNVGSFPNAYESINMLLNQNNYDDIKNLRVTSIKYADFPGFKYPNYRNFLLCLSDKPDLLNMWNYYIHSNSYEGYSIGFNIAKLLKTFDSTKTGHTDPFTVYYGDIIYDEKAQQKEISELVDHIEQYARVASNKSYEFAALSLRQYIDTQGYFYKHKSFKAEEEFRIILSISQERVHKEKTDWFSNMRGVKEEFFVRNGLIVPSFSVKIPTDAISRVYLSPTAEVDIAKQGVRELLNTTDFEGIKIYNSSIPIRY